MLPFVLCACSLLCCVLQARMGRGCVLRSRVVEGQPFGFVTMQVGEGFLLELLFINSCDHNSLVDGKWERKKVGALNWQGQ